MLETNLLNTEYNIFGKLVFCLSLDLLYLVKILLSKVTYVGSFIPTLISVVILFIYNKIRFICYCVSALSSPYLLGYLIIYLFERYIKQYHDP